MSTAFDRHKDSTEISEMYEVVRTAKLVVGGHSYRVEVLKCYSNSATPYVVDYQIEERITAQPTYPQTSGKFERKPEGIAVWKSADLPWVVADDPDDALALAMSHMEELRRQAMAHERLEEPRSQLRMLSELPTKEQEEVWGRIKELPYHTIPSDNIVPVKVIASLRLYYP